MTISGLSAGAKPMNHEFGSPGPAELGRAGLAGDGQPVDLGAGRVAPAELAVDRCDHGRRDLGGEARRQDPPEDLRRGRRRPALPGERLDEVRPHEGPAVGDRRGHEGHLEGRHERLGLAVRRVGDFDVVGEAARTAAVAVGHLGDPGRQVERQLRPEAQLLAPVNQRVRRPSRGPPGRTRCCRRPRSPRRS